MAYALVGLPEQRALFDYYRPHLALTEAQLREHRRRVMDDRPSLPHRAGKAYKRLVSEIDAQERMRAAGVGVSARRPYEQNRPIAVMPLLRPEPDLSQVVILMALHLAEKERKKRERNSGWSDQ